MDPAFEAQLRESGVTFTGEDATLLETIDEEGSLNRAATELGRSYSHAQKRLGRLEDAFGTLVKRQRGGAGGGGSTLTDTGRALLARFDRLERGYASVADVAETVLDGEVRDRDGELGRVDTAAGTIRAIVGPEMEEVHVTIPADAVVLHAPEDVPPADGTSARNRFSGTVVSVTAGESVAKVAVDVGAAVPLLAVLTHDSVDRLSLEPGTPVTATVKATATRCASRA
ncbi:MAG: TOBE domain-containing protein [Halodesulfurarchaeum sp.]